MSTRPAADYGLSFRETLSILGQKELAAARALSEPQQAALMRELALAAKTIVMAPAFQVAHDAYIAKEYEAVNHGLKVKSAELLRQCSGRRKCQPRPVSRSPEPG